MIQATAHGQQHRRLQQRTRAMLFRPLSTYMVLPVTAEASGDSRNAAVAPTSEAFSSFWIGAFSCEYLRACSSSAAQPPSFRVVFRASHANQPHACT